MFATLQLIVPRGTCEFEAVPFPFRARFSYEESMSVQLEFSSTEAGRRQPSVSGLKRAQKATTSDKAPKIRPRSQECLRNCAQT